MSVRSHARSLSRTSAVARSRWMAAFAFALLTPAFARAEASHDVLEVDGRTPNLPPEYLVYEGEGVSVAYHPSTRDRVRALLPRLEAMRDRMRAALGTPVLEHVEVRVAALAAEMTHLSPGDAQAAARVAVFRAQRLVVVAAETDAEDGEGLDELVAHGFAHIALGEATRGRRIPAWFDEGFADTASGTASRSRLEALAVSALRREVPSIDALDRRDPSHSPIERRAVAADLVAWLRERNGGAGVAVFAAALSDGASSRRALEAAAGAPLDEIEQAHRSTLGRRFGFAPVLLLAAVAWLVIATISLARRARRAMEARRDEAAPERVAAAPRGRRDRPSIAPSARATPVADSAPTLRHPHTSDAEGDVVEPGVPKVRRSGGWHTLH